MTHAQALPATRCQPRSNAWMLLAGSAAAVAATGIIATALVFSRLSPSQTAGLGAGYWIWLLAASTLTVISLAARALRWIFLLRRSEVRIPIRDAYIGYLSGLTLLLAPFLVGEIFVRASVHRDRGNVPPFAVTVLNIWERLHDIVALTTLAALASVLSGVAPALGTALLVVLAATTVTPVRRAALRATGRVTKGLVRETRQDDPARFARLLEHRAWIVGWATSVVAWVPPGIALWGLARVWTPDYSLLRAQTTFALSTLTGGLTFAPGGVVRAANSSAT